MKAWQIAVLVVLAALIVTHWTAGWALLGLLFLARWAWNLRRARPFVIDELHRPGPVLVRGLDGRRRPMFVGVDLATGPDACVTVRHQALTPEESADLRRKWEDQATRGEFVDLPAGPGMRLVCGVAGAELRRGELVNLSDGGWVPAWKPKAERAYFRRRSGWSLLGWFAAGWWFVRRLLRRGR